MSSSSKPANRCSGNVLLPLVEWDAALLLLQDIESSSSSWSEEEEEEESRSSTRERPAEEWDETVEDVPLLLFVCVCVRVCRDWNCCCDYAPLSRWRSDR